MSSTTEHLPVTETAKLLRAALKAAWPGMKFSVRSDSYSGGASIRVRYTDGPTKAQVEAIAHLYEGASFDGMIDLKSHHTSLIADPDGTVREVHHGADYVFVDRDITIELIARLVGMASLNEQYLARTHGGEQCGMCGTWIPEGDCWIAGRGNRRRMVCNQECAARFDVTFYDADAHQFTDD